MKIWSFQCTIVYIVHRDKLSIPQMHFNPSLVNYHVMDKQGLFHQVIFFKQTSTKEHAIVSICWTIHSLKILLPLWPLFSNIHSVAHKHVTIFCFKLFYNLILGEVITNGASIKWCDCHWYNAESGTLLGENKPKMGADGNRVTECAVSLLKTSRAYCKAGEGCNCSSADRKSVASQGYVYCRDVLTIFFFIVAKIWKGIHWSLFWECLWKSSHSIEFMSLNINTTWSAFIDYTVWLLTREFISTLDGFI